MSDIEAAVGFFQPLDIDGPLLELDTAESVDVDQVAAWVRDQMPRGRRQ
jgi:hypothetical protein